MRGAPPSEIVERFARLRRDDPDRPLIHLPPAGRSITAAMLWDAAAEQQARIAAAGIGPDDLILYAAGNRPELFALWLACRTLGAALMPVDAGTTSHEIGTLADRFGVSRVVLPSDAAVVPEAAACDPYVDGLVLVTPRRPMQLSQSRGAAALKLTSGSTGLPRATCTTEPQLLEDVAHITEAMDIRPRDCQICALPLSHAYGIGNLVLPLLVQGTAIVLREGFVPHQLAADAESYGARVFPGVPFMFDHFRDHLPAGSWPRGLDLLVSAGARLEPTTLLPFHRSFGLKIHSFYGTSETGGIAYDDSADLPEEGSVGRPMPGVTIGFRPEDGAPADGGRVHVASGAVSSGYVGPPVEDDGFTSNGFLTGDYGRLSAQGHLLLTGRASAFINVAGRKVQPEEIETVLREMPGVADVRVLGMADAARGQQIVACIVARGENPGLLSVRQFCAARLAPYKIPRRLVALERIPLTERGKTDRRQLEALVRERLREAPDSGVL
jgi:acyl-CoA synthetase (AMP-forming)/AMP-acid ligase II